MDTKIKSYLSQQSGLPGDKIDAMLPEFKQTLSKHMNGLTSAHRQDSLLALKEAAHTMKGALLSLGLSECAQLAQKIEIESGAGNTLFDYSLLIDTIGTTVVEFVDE